MTASRKSPPPAQSNVSRYWQAEKAAYEKAMRIFSGKVAANPKVAQKADLERQQFAEGDRAAFAKAQAVFGANIVSVSDPVQKAFLKGQQDALEKAEKAFSGHAETVKKTEPSFFKNAPESLVVCKMLNAPTHVSQKGMYIYQNWLTVTQLAIRLWQTKYEITWNAFKGFATDTSIFIEEVMEDMPAGSTEVVQLPDILREISDQWPQLMGIVGGARIQYLEEDEDLQDPQADRFEAVPVPNRKMEVLADVYSKTPDAKYIYTEEAQRAVEDILRKLRDTIKILQGMQKEIKRRSELYDNLIAMRNDLNRIREVFDPRKLDKTTTLPDLAVVEDIKKRLIAIAQNPYLAPDLANLVMKINEKIDLDTFIFKVNANTQTGIPGVDRVRRGVNRIIIRLNKDRIMEGLRAVDAYYNEIWAAIHKGRQLVPRR